MAGILERLLGRGGSALATKRDPWKISEIPGSMFGRGGSSAGVRVDEETALSLSGVFAGVNLLSRVIGALPRSVYRKSGRERTVAETHPAHRVLHSVANPEMTAATFWRVFNFHRALWGNGYAEIGWDQGGNVRSLWPVEPWRVCVDRDGEGGLYYRVDGTRRVQPADMFHVPLVSYDGRCGHSWIDYAITSLGLGMASQEFAARLFANGARPGGVLRHPLTPAKEARDEFQRSWEAAQGGVENAGRTAVIWGGWEYHPEDGSFAPEEAQLLETRKFAVEETARWLGIPPHLLGELSRATFNNIEELGISFVIYCLGPLLVDVEQEIDRKLLNPPSLYCKHNLASLLRGNSAARAAFYREMSLIGAFSPNDILELEDMNPVKDGDSHFVQRNMWTLEQAVAPPPEPPAATPVGAVAPAGQDGGTQSPASETPQTPASPDKGQDKAPMKATLGLLVAHTLARLARVEAQAIRRAVAKPDKLFAWMDEFYPEHEQRLGEALAPVLRTCADLVGDGGKGDAVASGGGQGWCQVSRADLLEATGVRPAELSAAIEAMLGRWENGRVPSVAALLIEEVSRAKDAA